MILYLLSVLLITGLFTSIEGISKGSEVGDSTSLIAEFVQNFMKPYIETYSGKVELPYPKKTFQPHHRQSFSKKKFANVSFSSLINSSIQDVVNELQLFLQENGEYFDNDHEETTIIEISPTSKHGNYSFYKYEKMKSDIKLALEKENVSDKTKRLVTKTLDELIAQVISNKMCNWSSKYLNVSSGTQTITLREWDGLKKQFLAFLKNKKGATWSRRLHMFNDFHDFFSKVIQETQYMTGRSRFKCQVIDDYRTELTRSSDECIHFKVCSQELRDFLQNVYDSFNETVVSIFTNYASMYLQDVSADEDGKTPSVPHVIQRAAKIVEQRVAKVYIQELPTFKLDRNKTQEVNIRILRNHVKSTMKHILKHINNHLATDLAPLKKKLLQTVHKDINMNLNVEMGNQETELKQRICKLFMTCNGRAPENRRSFSGNKGGRRFSPNSIYVELKVDVVEKPKNFTSFLADLQLPINKKTSKKRKSKKPNFRVTRTTVNANYNSSLYINVK